MGFVALYHGIWILRNDHAGKGLQRYRTYPDHGMLKYPLNKGEEACAGHARMLCICDSICGWAGTSARQSTALCSPCLGGWRLSLSAHCCVPWLSPSPTEMHSSRARGEELALACSTLQCDVWCSADVPLKVPGKQSHTGTLDVATGDRCSLKFLLYPPTSKDRVFQQCIKPAAPQDPRVSGHHLSRAPVGFLPCIACVVSGPSNTPENVVKRGLGASSS